VEKKVRFVWRIVLMPILFGLTGITIVFANLPSAAIGNACAIVSAGAGADAPLGTVGLD
jgi:hypothetical protein